MSDPRPSEQHDQTTPAKAERQPWQKLGFDKIAATDAGSGAAGGFDGLSYS